MYINLIILKDEEIYEKVSMEKIHGEIYIYKWKDIEKEGAYSFKIESSRSCCFFTFSHTVPFSKHFEGYVSDKEEPKPIAGFREKDDVLITFDAKECKFYLKRMHFTRFIVDTSKYGYTNPSKVEMPASFNGWNIFHNELNKISENIFETILPLDDGIYEYKLVIDGHWVPYGDNLKLVVGEMGWIFPKGEIGNGHFSYDAKDSNDIRKAIKHNEFELKYLNKSSFDEVEVTIRTQINDIEKIEICIEEEKDIQEIYEMERVSDLRYGFDYFKKVIKLKINKNNFKYYFKLIDGGTHKYYGKNGLVDYDVKYFEIDYSTGKYPIFNVPQWAKEAVWYNIFPDRFYNGNEENDPIYNEFGPEDFKKPSDEKKASLIKDYKWGAYTDKLGEFENNKWTSDFEERIEWEKKKELEVNYPMKYARMYGGDLKGIKDKIPYLKELGITAIWLNPVFFAESNHKYGAADFRHISPDFGVIRQTGNDYSINVSKNNKYGNKTYLDVLDKEKIKEYSELELLRINLTGENRGKNGYNETEHTDTWVWTESDLIAIDLIKELHRNGIRVIFDAVFNHSGPRHWSFEQVMLEGKNSKYKDWYRFHDFRKYKDIPDNISEKEAYKIFLDNKNNVHYSGWAGFRTLPEFDSYNKEFMEYIFNITKKWLLGPDGKISENWQEDDGIDGFRLDVPNCLQNQNFWVLWRKVVKETKPESYITAELWGDARSEINDGVKYDTIMNYEWLKVVIGYFINQGKNFDKSYKLKSTEFFNELKEKRNWYPLQAFQASQNLNGSHDTDRLISRIINDKLGRDLEEGKQIDKGYNTIRPDLAENTHKNTTINWIESEIKPKDILKLISIFQMTYIGAPMLYYGDEAGMWGATDPYCRKPMLWKEYQYDDETDGTLAGERKKYSVNPDLELFEWYKKLINIRNENKTLSLGQFKELLADDEKDIVVYERFDEYNKFIIILNNSFKKYEKINFYTNYENLKFIDLITEKEYYLDSQGYIEFDLNAKTGLILKKI